uniref:uncharacterized protein n=1 Tax=Centroberyx gerrardi TaxID=166262 RepID=UPI003AAD486B
MKFQGRREVINQTSFVDVSVVGVTTAPLRQTTSTTTISSTTALPPMESSSSTLASTSETMSEKEVESPDFLIPTDAPSMFSTSMAPPRPSPTGHEEVLEELITTTVSEEDSEDLTTATPVFDVEDFVRENETQVEAVHRGDTFPAPPSAAESTETAESVSEPTEEPDDHSVIEVGTIRPDVRIEASPSTEPMFAVGKTEETIVDAGVTTEMTSDLTDTPTASTELTSEELFSSSASTTPTPGLESTTPFLDYDPDLVDEIGTDLPVEGLPPVQEVQSSSPAPTTITTFMCNTQPGSEAEITTITPPPEATSTVTQTTSPTKAQDAETPVVVYKEETSETTTETTTFPAASVTVTAAPVLIDSGTSAEDVTSSPSSVHVFDESTARVPESTGEAVAEEEDTATDIDTEFFTSPPMAAAVDSPTTTPGAAVPEGRSIQVTTVMQKQNESVDQGPHPQDSQSPVIPVVPDHPTPSLVDGEPILSSGDTHLFSQAAVTITPTVSFINGKHEITLEPQSPDGKEAKGDQVVTNMTALGASDEMTTVFDYNLTDLSVDSSPESTEEPFSSTSIPTSAIITDVDDYDPYLIPIVESIPPHIVPEEDELTTKGPAQTDTTSDVTQTEKSKDQSSVSATTELHTATVKAETTEESKSTSAAPAVEDPTQSASQTVFTPTSDDADGKTPTSTSDAESSTQDVEEGTVQESQTPKESASSTLTPSITSGPTSPGEKVKTEITPATGSTDSSSLASTPAESAESTVTSQGGTTASQMPSVSSTEKDTIGILSTPVEEGSGAQTLEMFTTRPPSSRNEQISLETTSSSSLSPADKTDQPTVESEVTSQTRETTGTDKTSVPDTDELEQTSSPTSRDETTPIPSEESIATTASPLYNAIEIIKTTMASFTDFFSQYTTQDASVLTELPDQKVKTSEEASITPGVTNEASSSVATSISPLPSTVKPDESISTTISAVDISKQQSVASSVLTSTVTAATSSYSSEKPAEKTSTLMSPVTPEATSVLASIDEDTSGDQTTDLSTKETAATPASSLFSTEKTTSLPAEEQESAVTGQTEKPSVTPITDKTEESSILTPTDEDGSGDQTPDMLIQTSPVTAISSLYSTEKPTSVSSETQENVATSQTEKAPVTPEASSSHSTTDESSGEQTSDIFTKETVTVTASSMFTTEKPETDTATVLTSAVTAASSSFSSEKPTERTSTLISPVTPETSSILASTDEDSSSRKTTNLSTKETAATTASSLFSTEKPTTLPAEEQESAVTGQTEKPSVTPITDKTEESSVLTPTNEDIDISSDHTFDFTGESLLVATTVSSMYSTETPAVTASGETEGTDTSKATVTAASSLYSTEKPTSVFPETQESVGTSQTEKAPVTPEESSIQSITDESSSEQTSDMSTEEMVTVTASSMLTTEKSETDTAGVFTSTVTTTSSSYSSDKPAERTSTLMSPVTPEASSVLASTDEDTSGDQTTDLSTKETAATTASSLFSTEKTTALPAEEQESAVTGQTEKPSVTPITDKTEESSVLTPTDEDGSGDQTPDMLIQTSPVTAVSSLYSTEKPTSVTPETQESVATSPPVTPEESSIQSTTDESSGEKTSDMSTKHIATVTASSIFITEKPETDAATGSTSAVTAASSSYSSEKTAERTSTLMSPVTPEVSSVLASTDEDSSALRGQQQCHLLQQKVM